MANEVYANGMEIACKSGNSKVIAAFPDVCLSPPPPPAGPVPIPYPVTSMSSDAEEGSKTVKIDGKPIMLKDKSYYKQCTGDEAATKSFGMGVITHCIQGKTYFRAWSSDVIVEDYNVDRHLDLTGSNGMSTTNQVPWNNFDSMIFEMLPQCEGVDEKFKLEPYKDKVNGDETCPPPQTGHHLVPGHLLGKTKSAPYAGRYTAGNGNCHHDTAPVICVLGKSQWKGSHYMAHYTSDGWEALAAGGSSSYSYNEALNNAAASAGMATDGQELEPGDPGHDCIKAQLDDYFEKCGIPEDATFTPASSGLNTDFAKGLPPLPRP
jgi:hypothetical protein